METGKEVIKINLANIIPNRFQPRISFDEESLNELANSIKMYGILQPLILRPLGDKYEIIAGERRYKAAQIAGLTDVPAILVNFDDQTSAELAIIENIQRKDLTAIEEAKSYKKLIDLGNYTQDQLAVKMGKSQSAIANKLRLLNLIPEAQDALMNNSISERHARSLLQLKDDPGKQREILNRIINERLTVKATDDIIRTMIGGNTMNEQTQPQDLNIETNPVDTYQPTPSINTELPNFETNFNPEPTPVPEYQANPTPVPEPINITPETNEVKEFTYQPEPTEPEAPVNIPNLNNDTFNLSQISDPNLNIPETPLANTENPTPEFDINAILNQQQPSVPEQDIQTPNFDSLLQEPEKPKEEEQNTEPLPQFAPASAPTNKYFPDLEKESVNMSFVNPYANIAPQQESTSSIDMTNAINETRQTIQKLETLGYKVTSEELDQPDSYQITIKIKKEIN